MSEAEPRRSVRATKGQHTKAFDDQPIEPPKKRGRKKKQEEEVEEEIIRCVCGATEQDGDSEEPWIACDKCGAWQHNVCMGMSVFTEDLPKNYYCEQCAPQNHKQLLAAMAKGEKPWEDRRKEYEEEQEAEKKKKKKGRGRTGKRTSDAKEELGRGSSTKASESPAPEVPKPKGKKETAKGGASKRKALDETDASSKGPASKARKVSEAEPKKPDYVPPPDLPAKLSDLGDSGVQATATFLMRSIQTGVSTALAHRLAAPPKGFNTNMQAEQWAIQTERAVRDSHADSKQYAAQCRTLAANLKSNPELCAGLIKGTLTPLMLAVMTSDQMATKEQQQKTAEMRAKSEKQSILITEDAPRIRRNHKGEEIVENETYNQQEETRPVIRRPSARELDAKTEETDQSPQPENSVELPAQPQLHIDTQGNKQSPRHSEFDINKVFSSVKSQSPTTLDRRQSAQTAHSNGPGVDPDVDRLLQDENESPPYSPTDESDPDVVWRGSLVMNSIAEFPATAKFSAGANLSNSIGLPWSTLIPKRLVVAGRIDDQKAIEYLCGLRYADHTDIVVVSVSPMSEASRPGFQRLFDYFTSKKKYAVIGDKGVGNVRDTYLVPVPTGDGDLPEFLLNFADNLVPQKRTEPVLLAVFVYRNQSQMQQPRLGASHSPVTNTPTPTSAGLPQRAPAPAFSPTTAQGNFQSPHQPPAMQNNHPTQGAHQVVPPNQPPHGHVARPGGDSQEQQREYGEAIAREVLGPFIECPTVQFLLPQAFQMSRKEWEIVRRLYELEPRSREDLQRLSVLLQSPPEEAAATSTNNTAQTPSQPAAAPSA